MITHTKVHSMFVQHRAIWDTRFSAGLRRGMAVLILATVWDGEIGGSQNIGQLFHLGAEAFAQTTSSRSGSSLTLRGKRRLQQNSATQSPTSTAPSTSATPTTNSSTSTTPSGSASTTAAPASSGFVEARINATTAYHEVGNNYIVYQNFGTPSDTLSTPTLSVLKIYENGKELGPAHSLHANIRQSGQGRFSHWETTLYFSASDNSNPVTNGRRYTYRIYSQSTSSAPSPSSSQATAVSTPIPTTQPAPSNTQPPSPTNQPASATTTGPVFYVSPNGSDSNSGTLDAPWRTIEGTAQKLVAGDTAILLDGVYEEGWFRFTNSGTATKPITIRAQNKWGAVVSSRSGCQPAIDIDKSYITIEDIRIAVSASNVNCDRVTATNAAITCWESNGPSPSNPSTGTVGCKIRGIKVDPSSARTLGIKVRQDYSLVENSEVHSSLEAFNNVGTVFRNNVVYGGDAWGDSIYGKAGVRNMQIHDNIIHFSQGGRGLFLGGNSSCCWFDSSTHIEAYNSVAYNNVVINEGGQSFAASLGMVGTQDSALFNNVVVGGQVFFTLGSQSGYDPLPSNANPTVKNNIISCNGAAGTSSWNMSYTGNLTLDYNNFHNCSSGIPTQPHSILGDPLFVNPSSDWHLQQGSPAFSSGVQLNFLGFDGQTIDLSKNKDGIVRMQRWSLGIY